MQIHTDFPVKGALPSSKGISWIAGTPDPCVAKSKYTEKVWAVQLIKGLNFTCLFLMEVWMTACPRVNFVMREALIDIYTWILCLSYFNEKQTNDIQSLYVYFIKIVPFWLWNISF